MLSIAWAYLHVTRREREDLGSKKVTQVTQVLGLFFVIPLNVFKKWVSKT